VPTTLDVPSGLCRCPSDLVRVYTKATAGGSTCRQACAGAPPGL